MSSESPAVRVGTRASALATTQTNFVIGELKKAWGPSLVTEVNLIRTQGDKEADVPLRVISGKGVFTKELEAALLAKTVDIAVHSLKDLPTILPEGLTLGAVMEREDPTDALVLPASSSAASLAALPLSQGGSITVDQLKAMFPGPCRIGTSSLRRRAQIMRVLPQAEVLEVRGNVATRLSKVDAGQFDCLVLAVAGLKRLGLHDRISARLDSIMLHAVGQGALAIECRSDDTRTLELLSRLHHPATYACVAAERALLRALDGGCRVPIGVSTRIVSSSPSSSPWGWAEHGSCSVPVEITPVVTQGLHFSASSSSSSSPDSSAFELTISGGVYSEDGKLEVSENAKSSPLDAVQLGKQVAAVLSTRGAVDILAPIYSRGENLS